MPAAYNIKPQYLKRLFICETCIGTGSVGIGPKKRMCPSCKGVGVKKA